jgi:UDP-N-acetylglucosamine--N-acetylmuramyl-(pentapeptide) pyrophosphoryl-undecaprenol N-acetylglucosamine transferase
VTTLLVASTGGHLTELVHLAPRLDPPDPHVLWVTNDTLQSRSILSGRDVVFVPYQGSRNVLMTLRNGGRAVSLLRRHRPDRVVSTGSGIALSFLPLARARGIPTHYIESGTRVLRPSVTGRVLEHLPAVHCYTQHRAWAGQRWAFAGSILDGFEARRMTAVPSLRRVVVVLGSWRQSFRRLVERLVEILPAEVETVWQTGHTDVSGLVDAPSPWLPARDLDALLRDSDLVITHAGMGASLDALSAGKLPVVVPREAAYGEQVDDHQTELARELDRLGLAVVRSPATLTGADLVAAAGWRVSRAASPPGFRLTT